MFSNIILYMMHFMAWHIVFFLKSFRILEEFRKNPHIKIPPKSLCANSQILGSFQNSYFILKGFFLAFGPVGPAGYPACATHVAQPA
jgi:hypothetical protein